MTVTYTSEVTTCRGISSFLRLLARWRGSIYKIVWVDLLIFLCLFYAIYFSYHFLPDDSTSKQTFKQVIEYFNKYSTLIPLTFILGFYVNLVTTRWWAQYCAIPFPDNLAILVGASVKGQDDKAKIVRRTIMRYVCATFTITLTMLSPRVKKRFPTLDHFIDAGLITKDEKKIMEDLDNEFPSYSKYWLPLAWSANIVTRARHEGLIRDDVSVKTVLEELNLFRTRCGTMLDYDWISIPLVYTQVVTIAVYSYFIVSAIGRQFIEHGEEIGLYFPIFPVLEFFFYMGWLKVAETLINPFGDDDDDFEVVWMVDRHLQVSYLLVDKIHHDHPKLMRDQHWFEVAPNSLPFTVASQNYMKEYPFPSTINVNVKKADQNLIVPEEETITQPDGTRKRSGAHLWRLYGKNIKQRNAFLKNVPLKKVVTHHHRSTDQTDELNEFDESVPLINNARKNNSCEDFEKLRKERLNQHKQRFLKVLEIMNKSKIEDASVMIDDIITF